jgi:putative ABC transport system permease protein
MDILENIRIGINALKAQRLRAILTMLGVIFGVAAVIAMVAIGEGARVETLKQIELMGINIIRIKEAAVEGKSQERAKQLGILGLSEEDAGSLSGLTGSITVIVPVKEMNLPVRYKTRMSKVSIVGTTPLYKDILNYGVRSGRFITDADGKAYAKVCVLGATAKRKLFLLEDPIGKEIRIGSSWYKVIGVMEDRRMGTGSMAAAIRDTNKDIYIPLPSMLKRIGGLRNLTETYVQADDPGRVREIADLLNRVLKRRHHDIENYEVIVPEELLMQSKRTQRIFNIVMGCIAGISLLVGGIGIMNIMLANVMQRTKEIGIRRAVGASRKDILWQFLTEAVIVSVAGGLIGIALGAGISGTVTLYAKWKTVISIRAVLLAFFISAGVGIIFGIYPARRSAELDPVEALRYE